MAAFIGALILLFGLVLVYVAWTGSGKQVISAVTGK